MLNVHPSVCLGIEASQDYFHVTAYLPAPASAKNGQYFQIASVDEQGKVTAVEAVKLEGDGSSGNIDPTEIQWILEEYLEENSAVPGADGKDDVDSADGVSIIHRGTDYWADVDKAEVKSYVDEAILRGRGNER